MDGCLRMRSEDLDPFHCEHVRFVFFEIAELLWISYLLRMIDRHRSGLFLIPDLRRIVIVFLSCFLSHLIPPCIWICNSTKRIRANTLQCPNIHSFPGVFIFSTYLSSSHLYIHLSRS